MLQTKIPTNKTFYCLKCGAEITEGNILCGECQEIAFKNAERVCPRCGVVLNDTTANYCYACGVPMEGAARAEPATAKASTMRYLLPFGRMGRLAFLVATVAIWVGYYLTMFAVGFFAAVYWAITNPVYNEAALEAWISGWANPVATAAMLIATLFWCFEIIKRLHDCGRPTWHIVFFFVPIWFWVELFMAFFRKGDKDTNAWG